MRQNQIFCTFYTWKLGSTGLFTKEGLRPLLLGEFRKCILNIITRKPYSNSCNTVSTVDQIQDINFYYLEPWLEVYLDKVNIENIFYCNFCCLYINCSRKLQQNWGYTLRCKSSFSGFHSYKCLFVKQILIIILSRHNFTTGHK